MLSEEKYASSHPMYSHRMKLTEKNPNRNKTRYRIVSASSARPCRSCSLTSLVKDFRESSVELVLCKYNINQAKCTHDPITHLCLNPMKYQH